MIKQSEFLISGILICIILVSGGIFIYHNNNNIQDPNMINYLDKDNKLMDTMMSEMDGIPHTGDVSIDFLYGMIPHHESAVSMSENFLQHGGENEELKKIANDIINVQVSEIEDMKQLIQELEKNIQIDTDKETNYFKEYNKTANHTMSHQTFKNVDEAFAKGMITHHQMAIDMSETILKYTDNNTIKNMAENIIDTQTKEIQQMESIIQTIK